MNGIKTLWNDERGIGTVEMILILVEKYFSSYSLQNMQKEYIYMSVSYPSYQSLYQYQ